MGFKRIFRELTGRKNLKILLYEAEYFTFQMNSEILTYTIKFNKKDRSLCGPLFFFLVFFSLSLSLWPSIYLAFNMYLMFLCSTYVQNLQKAKYVFRKFCVLCYLVLFTFIFNTFATSNSMYIVMMIEKKILSNICIIIVY